MMEELSYSIQGFTHFEGKSCLTMFQFVLVRNASINKSERMISCGECGPSLDKTNEYLPQYGSAVYNMNYKLHAICIATLGICKRDFDLPPVSSEIGTEDNLNIFIWKSNTGWPLAI